MADVSIWPLGPGQSGMTQKLEVVLRKHVRQDLTRCKLHKPTYAPPFAGCRTVHSFYYENVQEELARLEAQDS